MLLFNGSKLAKRNLPAVLVYFSIFVDPSLFIDLKVEIILECKLIDFPSKACSISSIPENIPFGFLSFSSATTHYAATNGSTESADGTEQNPFSSIWAGI